MIKPNIPEHVSYGVIPIYVDEEGVKEYLLLQNHGGFWGFPKGHPEHGETPKNTAVREAREETSLEIAEKSLGDSVHYDYEQIIDGIMQKKRIVLYPVQISSKQIEIQTKEIHGYKWATCEEAIALINLPGIITPLKHLESEQLL